MKNTTLATLLLAATSLFSAEMKKTPSSGTMPEETWPKLQNDRSYNLDFFGDFIEWRYSSPNLAYGRSGVGSETSPITATGTSYYPDFDYDPGFKAGMAIKFGPSKAFDLTGIYTWLYSNPYGSVNADSTFLPINYFESPTGAVYNFASFQLNLHFNWIELQSGYTFNPNRYLALRPYMGLQSIIVSGHLHAAYDFAVSGAAANATTRQHTTSWSIGPRMGLDFTVHATDNFGFYSNVSWTQQASSLTMRTQVVQTELATGVGTLVQKGNLHVNHNVGIFSLELGPTWDQWFSNDSIRLQLRATWSVGTLPTGANLSFLNATNADIVVGSEFRGVNVRALLEF